MFSMFTCWSFYITYCTNYFNLNINTHLWFAAPMMMERDPSPTPPPSLGLWISRLLCLSSSGPGLPEAKRFPCRQVRWGCQTGPWGAVGEGLKGGLEPGQGTEGACRGRHMNGFLLETHVLSAGRQKREGGWGACRPVRPVSGGRGHQ